ncbi:MAG: NTP transferase domain-containing protein [Synergistales bacterium]|jgi:molybdenum cofactor cytidylyltransferase
MGTNKLLLPFGKGTVLSTVVNSAVEAAFSRIYIVTSAAIADSLRIPSSPALSFVVNENPEYGQSHSMRLGIKALGSGNVPFGILLGDMPMVSCTHLEAMREKFRLRPFGKTALVPVKDGRFGHPSFYEARWKSRLAEADGDCGGRKILKQYLGEILLDSGEEDFFLDIDTPEDYLALQERLRGRCSFEQR